MSQGSSTTYSSIEKLLQFQNSFLKIVHSQILSCEQGEKRRQALLRFQVMDIWEKNETFNEIMATLKRQLIEEKGDCDSVLKSYFLKLLELDYLPLLHINRYELTKLSIFGFDIYIDPLQAILQILNRLERVLYILQDTLKDTHFSTQITQLSKDQKNITEVLLQGWKQYYFFLHIHKLTLNLYMLKQYINIAITSLPKKDKEIIFTGVYNLYKRLIPILTQHQLTSLLQDLSDLNNIMYNFHPSFDFFLFYTYLEPVQQLIGVFNRINQVYKKCSHTNILTPLLFGIMNNYNSFVKFINAVQSAEYGHLLRVLLSGLIINLKLSILEYNEVLHLIGITINKLCLLKKMKISIITSELPKEWQQAKQFFISAFKSGYNSGEIQTWTLCDSKLIQPTIIGFLIKGLLLSVDCGDDQFIKRLQKQQLQQALENEVKQLTDSAQTLNGLMNNWKLLTLEEQPRQKVQQIQSEESLIKNDNFQKSIQLKRESKCLNVIRIINLLDLLKITSQRLVYSIVSALNNLKQTNSQLVQCTLSQSTQKLNQIITAINRKQPLTNLKNILPQFHIQYPPQSTFEDILPVYLHSFITHQAINNLVQLVASTHQSKKDLHLQQLLTALTHKYFVDPQQQPESTTTFQIYKSFDKQYKIPSIISNIPSQTNSVFSNLLKILTTSQTQNKRHQISLQIMLNLLKFSPHHIIAVMNLPTTQNQKITSFLNWLINSQLKSSRDFMVLILRILNQFAFKSEAILDLKYYLLQSFYLTVLDQILSSLIQIKDIDQWHRNINTVNQALNLIDLFLQIYSKFLSNTSQNTQSFSQVWTSLSDLIAYLLKNIQYQTSIIIKSCKINWKIIQIITKNNLTPWYHKLALNRIFSTITTQTLISNQGFKTIKLISSIKNYHISKPNSSQNKQKSNQKSQRYPFSKIKSFFNNNYLTIKQEKVKDFQQQNNIYQMASVIQEAKTQRKQIKIQSLMTSENYIPPVLSEQNLKNIYQQYCKQKIQDESTQNQNTKGLVFCLFFLTLNTVNHQNLWKIVNKSEDKIFIQHLSFTRQTINEMNETIRHFQNIKKTQHKKDQQILFKQQLKSMLGLDLVQNNVNGLELLASSYYFDVSKLEIFLKIKEIIWFLIVYNNSNWRQFNEVFSTYMKNTCFLSNLLECKEYLFITHQMNNDYNKKVQEFSFIIDQFSFYVQKKLNLINLLQTVDSEKENSIRKQTLLINVKMLLLKVQIEKVLKTVIIILRQLQQLSLPNIKFKGLILSLHNINKICNKLIGGNIKIPDFNNHNLYTTSLCEEKQFHLGIWIEQCQKQCQIQANQKEKFKYVPSLEFIQKLNKVQDSLTNKKNETNETKVEKIVNIGFDKRGGDLGYEKLREHLKNYLQNQTEKIGLKYQKCIEADQHLVGDFYCLGYLYYIQKSQKCEADLSQILGHMTKRQRIQLETIKQVDPQAYHQLKRLIINNQALLKSRISSQEKESENVTPQKEQSLSQRLYFVWNDKQLRPKERQTVGNQYNKGLYTQLVAEQVLNNSYIKLNSSFATGYINASIINHKN